MTLVQLDPNRVADAARATTGSSLTSSGAAALHALTTAANDRADAEEDYVDAVRVHERAWRAALAADWTPAELRRLGLVAPRPANQH